MSDLDKEFLITDEKRKSLNKPAIYSIDNFPLGDQKILSSQFLISDLENVVQERIKNGCFIILNESSVNAYAYCLKGYNVVAISLGSIYRCLYAANLFMLSDAYFPEIGDVLACYSDVTALKYPPVFGEDGEISFSISGDNERRNTGYIIAALAIKYIVYHEIGHHELGHLNKYNQVFGLDCGETGKVMHKKLSPDEYKLIETKADIYAVQEIVREFDILLERWNPLFEVPLGHLELALLLITALVIVKESLDEIILSINDIDSNVYPPTIVRLVISLQTIIGTDKQILDEYRHSLMYPLEGDDQEENILDLDDNSLKNKQLSYLANATAELEKIYSDIFLGRHDQSVFQSDLLGCEWWQRLE